MPERGPLASLYANRAQRSIAGARLLVLHIGTHKTGTSALQTFLYRQSEALAAKSVHYLRAGQGAGRAHHALAWAVRGYKGAQMSVWDEVRAELAASRAQINVISSEAMWFANPEAVRAQLEGAGETRIVVYLRRQDKYLQSLYKQAVASGRKADFRSWLESHRNRGDYLTVLRAWAAAFGAEALTVRPHERSGRTIDIVKDFAGLLGLDAKTDLNRAKPVWQNPSPRRELLELIRAVNHLDLDIDRDAFFYAVVRRNPAYIRSGDLLTYEECKALMEGFAEANRILGETFYRDPQTPLFPELASSEPPAIWPPGGKEHLAMTADVMDALIKAAAGAGATAPPRSAAPARRASGRS